MRNLEYNYIINLEEGKMPLNLPIYNLSYKVLRDTPVTPYTHLPVSTVYKTAIRRDLWQSNGNLPYSAIFR